MVMTVFLADHPSHPVEVTFGSSLLEKLFYVEGFWDRNQHFQDVLGLGNWLGPAQVEREDIRMNSQQLV